MSLPLTLYFGYGSNLWLEQMHRRCPSSIYLGVGRLAGYRWIINRRGYANIIPSGDPTKVVYGLVYDLPPEDVAALDRNEDVPHAYTKEIVAVEFWKSSNGGTEISRDQWEKVDVTKAGEVMEMLVYIDRQRTQEYEPKEEYVYRMNMGINDAVAMGVPAEYVQEQIRPFIPPIINKEVEDLAKEQAMSFKEEEGF